MRNTNRLLSALFALLLAAPLIALADGQDWRTVEGDAFTFTEVRPGVWHAVGGDTVAAGSNGAVVVNERDVLVVDSHMTPSAAKALLADLERITDKPVRYLVNTHFHFDHTHGNEAFGTDVEIVAHEFTRWRVAAGDTKRGRGYEGFIGSTPQSVERMKAQLDTLSDEEREQLQQRMAFAMKVYEESEAVTPRAPTLALREAVTLYRGGREIRLLHFGRGHTGGDVVVYLPAERALITGDLLTAGLPYMGDAFVPEWVAVLDEVAALDVEVILPGHGPAYTEVERARHLQLYLIDLWQQARHLHAAGMSAEEAAAAIELGTHAEHFPQIDGPGVPRHAVDRLWELLDAGYIQPAP
jgi:glyoxylase-like metal-dependent hydrolase (beta-lactamase superfamily II)